ncbi:AraC family transcriptional regulator [Hahella sp. NBU794]|uniref:AraC family transcriptional regulator n=1 Tax=Hahella sp. NBU794 TaxID=3422590 RepID=UPI003D6F0846
MKALYEKVRYPEDASWRFFLRQLDELPFQWHYHPEYELTYTLNSAGQRYVGDHVDRYESGDLVLIGPNLPHSWRSSQRLDEKAPHTVYVLWFNQQWVDRLLESFPEYSDVGEILRQSRRGLRFRPTDYTAVDRLFTGLPEQDPRRRLLTLLSLLGDLAQTPYRPLASANFYSGATNRREQDILDGILDAAHQAFADKLTVEDMARRHNMSVSKFSRFFSKHMNQSFNQYLTQIRLGQACSKLINSKAPIGLIAEQTGFNNLSNFNRLFKKHKGVTPQGFRKSFIAAGQ